VSEYEEIVEESGDYRAVIKLDMDAQQPEDYGMVPVLRIDSNGYGSVKAEAFNEHAEPYVHAFNVLSDLYHGNGYVHEVFDRYMRIFHGTVAIDSYNLGTSREYGYVAFDTAEWREKMGCTEDQMRKEEKDGDLLHDVRVWAEGDVWGVGLEKRVTWSTEDEDYEDMDQWEETPDGFVWGFYGHEYAEQEARDLLKNQLAE
jgi:hypothetical protein